MAKKNAENNYNTNLASEYLMMSLLCRAGKEAYLSLGNKKGVDIIIRTKKHSICVLEVKGVNKNMDWMISNSGIFPNAPNLFFGLIGFEGEIENINSPAKFYMIPSELIASSGDYKISGNNKTVYLSHKVVRERYMKFLNTFASLDEYLSNN